MRSKRVVACGFESTVPHELFNDITDDGIAAIRDGRIIEELPPQEGGRWGLSVVFRLTGWVAEQLGVLTAEAIEVLGEHHWRSGSGGSAHITIRALDNYSTKPLTAESLGDYLVPVRRAVADLAPFRFEFNGLSVSPSTLMACADDVEGTAGDLRRRIHAELREKGWLENSYFANERDPIWYATLVHFTRALDDAGRFIDWFSKNRTRSLGSALFSRVDLCRWRFETTRMVPDVVASVGFGQSRSGVGS